MSWEGYFQQLCKKGHYTTKSAEYQDEDMECLHCGAKIIWINTVNVTNGSFENGERIDGYVILEEKSRKVCKHCNSVLEITYKIPRKGVRK